MIPLTKIIAKQFILVLSLLLSYPTGANAGCIFGAGIQATETNIGIMLNWISLQEFDNDHFIVQRSDDGKFYYSIGEVSSKEGNYPIQYRFLDTGFGQGHTWYRVQAVDQDGKMISGPACKLLRKAPNKFMVADIGNIEVGDDLNTQIECASGGLLKFRIRDDSRKENLHGIAMMNEGINHLSIPLTMLPEGSYHVDLCMNDECESLFIRKLSQKESGLLTGN